MKHAGQYALAGLLVLATVPIYHYILTRRVQADSPAIASRPVPARLPMIDCNATPTPACAQLVNMSEAFSALRAGRAKCVAGVIYRTADHVIEPWPGNVPCDDPYGFKRPRGV